MINTNDTEIDEDEFLEAFNDDEEVDDTFPTPPIRECCGAGCLRCNYPSK